MQFTRTERLILEIAAERFGVSPDAPALQAEMNGVRPQLGQLLVEHGLLSEEQLDEILEQVFGRIQAQSDALAPPTPPPVPRPVPGGAAPGQLGELVKRLTGLLDVLVAKDEGTPLLLQHPGGPSAPATPWLGATPATGGNLATLRLDPSAPGLDPPTAAMPGADTVEGWGTGSGFDVRSALEQAQTMKQAPTVAGATGSYPGGGDPQVPSLGEDDATVRFSAVGEGEGAGQAP